MFFIGLRKYPAPSSWNVFIRDKYLILPNTFILHLLTKCFLFLYSLSVNLITYIFFNIEQTLHSWDEPHLAV